VRLTAIDIDPTNFDWILQVQGELHAYEVRVLRERVKILRQDQVEKLCEDLAEAEAAVKGLREHFLPGNVLPFRAPAAVSVAPTEPVQ
jgi:hypothetical protein